MIANGTYDFLLPLVLGFTCNFLSAFTTAFSRRWGERRGTRITFLLRAVLGIPFWMAGLAWAWLVPAGSVIPVTFLNVLGGALCLATGSLMIYFAFATLRKTALTPSTRDGLVQHGIYAHLRHPMDAGMLLCFAGLFLFRPTWPVMAAGAVGVVWALAQAWAEERDLLGRLPEYRDYMRRVPGFIPIARRQ